MRVGYRFSPPIAHHHLPRLRISRSTPQVLNIRYTEYNNHKCDYQHPDQSQHYPPASAVVCRGQEDGELEEEEGGCEGEEGCREGS